MKQKHLLLAVLLASFGLQTFAQDDLLDDLNNDQNEPVEYISATYKGSKIINMQTNEMPAAGDLQFIILHRFGAFNDDFWYNFMGLDNANIRFSLDYSITDWLNVGIGRSSATKTWDGSAKIKLLRQSKGGKTMPLSMVLHSTANYTTARWNDGLPHNESDRFSFAHQLVMARKFNEWLSLQVTPMLAHYNLVETKDQPNDVFAIGFGGRIKVTQRIALTGEYTLQLNDNFYFDGDVKTPYENSASIGVDIETGGHVFQLHVTNSIGMADPQWIGRTTGSWGNGDIHLGFNISRVFTLVKPKVPEEPQW